jgi:hypothetical protein
LNEEPRWREDGGDEKPKSFTGGSPSRTVYQHLQPVLKVFSRSDFERAVNKHNGQKAAKGFDCWTQFVAMLFCQVGRAHSLREICGGLASVEGKLNHLGVDNAPARSTLSYANAHRPCVLFEEV